MLLTITVDTKQKALNFSKAFVNFISKVGYAKKLPLTISDKPSVERL
jgi:hypothetical protein